MKHSPTPWIQDGLHILGPDDITTATCRLSARPLNEQMANAAFIAHACNLHEELVQALASTLVLLKTKHKETDDYLSSYFDVLIRATR